MRPLINDGTVPDISADSCTMREANAGDFDRLMQLYTQLHNNPMPDASLHTAIVWQDIIKEPNHHVIVADAGGCIVSSCVCVIIPNMTHNCRPYALIENVITDKKFRKRGLASACLEYALSIAQQNNCYKIMLLTGAKDFATLNFYKNAGFNSTDKTAFIKWL